MRVDEVVELRAQVWVVSVDLPVGGGLRLHARSRPGDPDPRRAGLGGWSPSPYHALDPARRRIRSGRARRRSEISVRAGGDGAPVSSSPDELLASTGTGSTWAVFDEHGRHLRTVDGRSGATVWRFEHDGEGALARIVDRDGATALDIRRADDAVELRGPGPLGVRLELDEQGWARAVIASDGTTTRVEVDGHGRPLAVTDAAGRTRRVGYDDGGRVASVERPAGPSFSLVRHVDGVRTTVTRVGTDGREARHVTDRLDDGTLRRWTWCCGGEQPAALERRGGESTLSRPDGVVVRRTTERSPTSHRVARRVERPSGLVTEHATSRDADPATGRIVTSTELNGRRHVGERSADGTVTLRSPRGETAVVQVDEVGRPVRIDGPTGTLRYTWDDAGRVTVLADDEGSVAADYDNHGRLVGLRGPDTELRFDHDDHGRIVAQRWADGRSVQLGWGPAGELVSVQPPGRPATRFEHLDRGVISALVLPDVDGDVARQRFSYDPAGALAAVERADGRIVRIERDARGWTRAVTVDDGSGVTFDHEAASGRLVAARSVDGITERRRWDGDLLVGTEVDGPAPGSISCRRDADGRVAELAVCDAEPVVRRFDDGGRLVGLGPLEVSRDAATGHVVERRLGRVTERRVRERGRLTTRWILVDGEELVAEQRAHDELGRLAGLTTRVAGVVRTERYERGDAGRLVAHERDGAVTRWAYDANGNRVCTERPDGAEHLEHDARDRLCRWGGHRVEHDPDGELRAWADDAGRTELDHHPLGLLRQVRLADGRVVTHRHDHTGRRVATEVDGELVGRWRWWDPWSPAAEVDADGHVIRSFLGEGTGRVQVVVEPDRTLLVVADVQGSPRWLVDVDRGELVADLARDPWGAPLGDLEPVGPFGFLGGMVDGVTPLVHIGARHLVAGLGRWTTPDPLRYRGGDTNWYAYALGDPIERADRTGTKVELCRRLSTDARLASIGGEHVWVRTDSAEAGMGSHPFESTSVPFSNRVAVIDHTGEGDRDGAECEEVPDVDEECVNEHLQTPHDVGDYTPNGEGRGQLYGDDLGLWGPSNTCQSFAEDVLQRCGSAYDDDEWDPGSTPPSETAAWDGAMSRAPEPLDHTPDLGYTPVDGGSGDDGGDGSLWD